MPTKSNAHIAALLEESARQLRDSDEDAQPEIAREILDIVADMAGTAERSGPLTSSGRVQFGREFGPDRKAASGHAVIAFDDPSVVEDDQ